MHYVEYATSAGPGTLIEHGVAPEIRREERQWTPDFDEQGVCEMAHGWAQLGYGSIRHEFWLVSEARYNEFISIHGGTRAV